MIRIGREIQCLPYAGFFFGTLPLTIKHKFMIIFKKNYQHILQLLMMMLIYLMFL